jgi:hypothetical protein
LWFVIPIFTVLAACLLWALGTAAWMIGEDIGERWHRRKARRQP